jgi:hypothetical protein
MAKTVSGSQSVRTAVCGPRGSHARQGAQAGDAPGTKSQFGPSTGCLETLAEMIAFMQCIALAKGGIHGDHRGKQCAEVSR